MNRYMIKAAAVCTAAAIAAAPLTVKADESLSRTAAAGVAVALDSVSGRNADIKSVNNSTAISAGIAVALGNYYINDSIQNDTATVAGIEKILKLTPQEDNTQQEEPQPVVSVVDGYTNLGVANVDNWLNVREEPSLDASISGKLPMNAGCEILQALDGWYQITSGDVTGYVSADYLLDRKSVV